MYKVARSGDNTDMTKTNMIVKWISMISFGILLLGGLNFLFMGLFKFNFFMTVFGQSTVARVIYSILGLAALTLLIVIICKAFVPKREAQKIEAKIENVVKAVKSNPSPSSAK